MFGLFLIRNMLYVLLESSLCLFYSSIPITWFFETSSIENFHAQTPTAMLYESFRLMMIVDISSCGSFILSFIADTSC